MGRDRVRDIIGQVIELAIEYHRLTGRPLGVTGEVGEFRAATLLGLRLCDARTAGYDAVSPDGKIRYQVKARVLQDGKRGGRLSRLDVSKEFDAVLLVLMRENYEVVGIYEASRDAVVSALTLPGSRSRNEKGALSVQQFIKVGRSVWPRPAS
jgi:hypothetical protein